MSKPKSIKAPVLMRKRPLNLNIPADLAEIFTTFCKKNRRAGSVSREVQEMMIRAIRTRGERFGLFLPPHYQD